MHPVAADAGAPELPYTIRRCSARAPDRRAEAPSACVRRAAGRVAQALAASGCDGDPGARGNAVSLGLGRAALLLLVQPR